ncbi:MAG: 2-dehydropantoate 2-reductase [Geminicoccaceae bacterium]|nr:2-dehydropantoate 2-reductase [Geminicoccaceae bacterium]MCB9944049.1 2-dehydropantoate 2-reductase [Geminicoccaceae bacterium]
MHILMVGSGGVGGYFGARLQAAGRQVTFVARGGHLAAMRDHGLLIESPRGDLHLREVKVVDEPAGAGTADLVLIAVKLGDTAAVIESLPPCLGADTTIVSLQNGIDAEGMLIEAFGRNRVMGGVTHISAAIPSPGTVRQVGRFAKIQIGELDGSRSERLERLTKELTVDGMDFIATDSIALAIWEKFIFLATMSACTATSRCAIGLLLEQSESRAWIAELIAEAAAVARAENVEVKDGFEASVLANMEKLPRAMIASMAHDLDAGKPLELDWLSGAVVRLGLVHGIDTPAHRHAVAALAPHRAGRGA